MFQQNKAYYFAEIINKLITKTSLRLENKWFIFFNDLHSNLLFIIVKHFYSCLIALCSKGNQKGIQIKRKYIFFIQWLTLYLWQKRPFLICHLHIYMCFLHYIVFYFWIHVLLFKLYNVIKVDSANLLLKCKKWYMLHLMTKCIVDKESLENL